MVSSSQSRDTVSNYYYDERDIVFKSIVAISFAAWFPVHQMVFAVSNNVLNGEMDNEMLMLFPTLYILLKAGEDLLFHLWPRQLESLQSFKKVIRVTQPIELFISIIFNIIQVSTTNNQTIARWSIFICISLLTLTQNYILANLYKLVAVLPDRFGWCIHIGYLASMASNFIINLCCLGLFKIGEDEESEVVTKQD